MFDNLKREKIVRTLESYKRLTADVKNHWHIIQDKTVLLYTSTLLECDNIKILNICLDILEDFISNDANHEELVGTLGIFESLESLSIRSRNQNERLSERCGALADLLRKSAPPAFGTRTRRQYTAMSNCNATTESNCPKNRLYQIYIEELNNDNIWKVNQTLGATKGIISYIMDEEKKRFTIRVSPKLTIENIAKRIHKNCNLAVLVVKRNIFDSKEILVDILNKNINLSHHYFPEEDDVVIEKDNAIKINQNQTFARNAGEWIKSAFDFWNKSVY